MIKNEKTGRSRERRNDLIREALERAASGREPDISRMLDSVPEIMAEAERRRRIEAQQDRVTAIIPLAWKMIPGLATAAAVLVLASGALIFMGQETTSAQTEGVESWVFAEGDSELDTDTLLETIVGQENGDG